MLALLLLPLLVPPFLLLPLLLLPLLQLPVFPALSSLLCLPSYLLSAHSSLLSQHCSLFYYCLLLPSLSTALFPLATASSLLPLLSTVPSLHWFLPQLFHLFITSTLSCFLCQLSQILTAFSLYYLLSKSTVSSLCLLPPLSLYCLLSLLAFLYTTFALLPYSSTTSSLCLLSHLSTASSLHSLLTLLPSLSLCTTFFSLPSPSAHPPFCAFSQVNARRETL